MFFDRSNDHGGFYLLQSMVEHFPLDVLSKYIVSCFRLFFQRLTSSKTTKFIKNFLVFSSLYAVKCGGNALVETVDSIQAQMFGMVCNRLFIPEVQKVSGNTEKKICAVGMTKLLCETPAMLTGPYANYWPPMLQVKAFNILIKLSFHQSVKCFRPWLACSSYQKTDPSPTMSISSRLRTRPGTRPPTASLHSLARTITTQLRRYRMPGIGFFSFVLIDV